MFILGHVGISVATVHVLDRRADLRWVAVASMLPDIIDKPIWLLVPEFANGWTRSIGHSFTGVVFFSVLALLWTRGRAWPLILAYALHLALDRMWEDGHILFWPFDGFTLPRHPFSYMERWWRKLRSPWTISGEAIGLVLILRLAWKERLGDRGRRARFYASGEL